MSYIKKLLAIFSVNLTTILPCLSISGAHAALYEIKHHRGAIFYLDTNHQETNSASFAAPAPLSTQCLELLCNIQIRALTNAAEMNPKHRVLKISGGMMPRGKKIDKNLTMNIILGLSWIFTALNTTGFNQVLTPETRPTREDEQRIFVTIETLAPNNLANIMRRAADLARSLIMQGTLTAWHPQLTSIERLSERRVTLSLTGLRSRNPDTTYPLPSSLNDALFLFVDQFSQEQVSYHEHSYANGPGAEIIISEHNRAISTASSTVTSEEEAGATAAPPPPEAATAGEAFAYRMHRELDAEGLAHHSFQPYPEIKSWQTPERFIISFGVAANNAGVDATRSILTDLHRYLDSQGHTADVNLSRVFSLNISAAESNQQPETIELDIELVNHLPAQNVVIPGIGTPDFALDTLSLQAAIENSNVVIQSWTAIHLESYSPDPAVQSTPLQNPNNQGYIGSPLYDQVPSLIRRQIEEGRRHNEETQYITSFIK